MNKEYQRGYYAGAKGNWPDHRPPHPPLDVIKRMYDAARMLRNAADDIVASLCEDDELSKELIPGIDAVDEAFTLLSAWLKARDLPLEPNRAGRQSATSTNKNA